MVDVPISERDRKLTLKSLFFCFLLIFCPFLERLPQKTRCHFVYLPGLWYISAVCFFITRRLQDIHFVLVGLVKDHTCIQALALSQTAARSGGELPPYGWFGHQDIETTNKNHQPKFRWGISSRSQYFLGLKVRIMTQFLHYLNCETEIRRKCGYECFWLA